MRVASAILVGYLLLASCQKPHPDFTFTQRSPDGTRVATLRGFQPRGTIEGYLLLSFGKEERFGSVVTFRQIENGQFGWVSSDTLAVVADKLKFNALDSDYFPGGTVKSRVRLIACAREDMDCSALTNRLREAAGVKHILHFPEG